MTAFMNPKTFAAPVRVDPAHLAWNTVGHYAEYGAAQQAVASLSAGGFPVEHLDIIGSDLRLVERVTGRLTKARAASAGAASGIWFGLLMGALVSIFTTGAWLGLLLAGAVVGAAWGALVGFLGHAATRGVRDFASARMLVAVRYDLVVRNGHAEAARQALQQAGLLTAA